MIQIEEPSVEALITERLRAGHFDSVSETLLDALTHAPPPVLQSADLPGATGAEIFAAFQRCPDKDFAFGTEKFFSPVSEPFEF